jgi:hypothetical protein
MKHYPSWTIQTNFTNHVTHMEIKKKQPSELNLENVHNELAYSNHFQYKKHLKYQVQMLHHQNIDSNSLGKC